MHRHLRRRRERIDAHREGVSGSERTRFDDEAARPGRTEREGVALAQLQDEFERIVGYFLVSHVPLGQQGHGFTSEMSFTRPATPISP